MTIKSNNTIIQKNYISVVLIMLLMACSTPEQENSFSTENVGRLEEQELVEKQKSDSINKALSEIKVRIWNHTPLYFDADGVCTNDVMEEKVKITEIKDFNTTKSYTCAKGNYIQKLTVEGVFNGITIQFNDDKGKLVKELKNYNLIDAISFSTIDYQPTDGGGTKEKKDNDYQEWFIKASTINLLYDDHIFFSGKWKSSGWYIQ